MSTRDLSAFRRPERTVAVPPPAAVLRAVETDESSRVATPAQEPMIAWDEAPRRKVTTSIPARLHNRLRTAADTGQRFKGDLVVEAMRRHGEALDAGGRCRPARRRVRVEDATQCQLYLTDAERTELDALARRLGLSRSGAVTLLLERDFTN